MQDLIHKGMLVQSIINTLCHIDNHTHVRVYKPIYDFSFLCLELKFTFILSCTGK